jgi:hypothetical protein
VDRACGTHGRGEKRVQGFWWESLKEKDHLKDQGVDGRMGSKWTLGRLVGGVERINLAQDYGSLAGCCECGDELSGSGATELVYLTTRSQLLKLYSVRC